LTSGRDLRDKYQMRMVCKSAALHVALVAMLLRALLPAGWMPAAISSANASPFVICTVDGPVAPAKPSHAPEHNRNGTALCVFAAAAPLSSPASAPMALAPITFAAPIVFAAPRDVAASLAAYRPNAARAPPAFA
jgi:hypothetical protein